MTWMWNDDLRSAGALSLIMRSADKLQREGRQTAKERKSFNAKDAKDAKEN